MADFYTEYVNKATRSTGDEYDFSDANLVEQGFLVPNLINDGENKRFDLSTPGGRQELAEYQHREATRATARVKYQALILNEKYSFTNVCKAVESLSSPHKLTFLYQVHADYDREIIGVEEKDISPELSDRLDDGFHTFGKAITREIEKYERILKVEKRSTDESSLKSSPAEGPQNGEHRKTIPDFTLTRDQSALLLNYLFDDAEALDTQTRRAECIARVTGFKKDQLGKRLSTFKRLKDEVAANAANGDELPKDLADFRRDLEAVKFAFVQLNCESIVKKISAELG